MHNSSTRPAVGDKPEALPEGDKQPDIREAASQRGFSFKVINMNEAELARELESVLTGYKP